MKSTLFKILVFFSLICEIFAQSNEQSLQNEIAKIVQSSMEKKEICGAVVALTDKRNIIFDNAYGNKQVFPVTKQMTKSTIFDLASVTKPIATASSVMILLQNNKIGLYDNVSKYLPDFTSIDTNNPIKIIHLLTHTSGLPDYAPLEKLKKLYGNSDKQSLLKYIYTCKRNNEPQTKFVYSCLNFITLQQIVEKISGMDINAFSQKYIFKPLGMTKTSYVPSQKLYNEIAPTEKINDTVVLLGTVHDPLARVALNGISGNAGLFSNSQDLSKFAMMMLNGGKLGKTQIFTPEIFRELTTIPKGFEKFGRTLGWDISSDYAKFKTTEIDSTAICHTGYTGTSIVLDLKNKYSLIILTNRVHPEDKTSVTALRKQICEAVGKYIKMRLTK